MKSVHASPNRDSATRAGEPFTRKIAGIYVQESSKITSINFLLRIKCYLLTISLKIPLKNKHSRNSCLLIWHFKWQFNSGLPCNFRRHLSTVHWSYKISLFLSQFLCFLLMRLFICPKDEYTHTWHARCYNYFT